MDAPRRDETPRPADWAGEVIRAMNSLDTVSSTALRLVYWRRASPSDVAKQLGVPEREIKIRVAQALQRVALILTAAP